MTLSQMIKLRTDHGLIVVDFLVDVMQDRYEDFRICHRLEAAKLLTTYGNEDAPDFIDDNTTDSPSNTRKRKPRQPTKFDTELARVIREDTRDGRYIARFLIDVMLGDLTRFRPHHRMSAARELLDRGFGKSARAEKVVRPRIESGAGSELVEGPIPTNRHSRERRALHNPLSIEGEGWGEGENLTPQNTAASTAVLEQPRQQPEPETAPHIDVADDTDYLLDICDSPLHDFMSECEHPDFDPCLATIDEEYFQSFTDCTDPECEVHGDPPDFDPNDYHY